MILSTLFLAFGHISGALAFYFTHRFIFHGKIGKLPILRKLRAIHTRHHARPDLLERAVFPGWSKLLIVVLMIVLGLMSIPFAIGVCSFFPVYAYRHWKAHNGSNSYWARHHMHHHLRDPYVNYGGIYPVVDVIFGTNSAK